MNMTPDENTKLKELIEAAQLASHEWCESPVTTISGEILTAAEQAVPDYVDSLLAPKDAEIKRLKEQSRILRDKLETANDTIKRLQSNQIPEMDDLSHNARAAFYKSILPKRLIEAWQSASDVLDGKGGDWKASLTSVYERLDDILAEFELF